MALTFSRAALSMIAIINNSVISTNTCNNFPNCTCSIEKLPDFERTYYTLNCSNSSITIITDEYVGLVIKCVGNVNSLGFDSSFTRFQNTTTSEILIKNCPLYFKAVSEISNYFLGRKLEKITIQDPPGGSLNADALTNFTLTGVDIFSKNSLNLSNFSCNSALKTLHLVNCQFLTNIFEQGINLDSIWVESNNFMNSLLSSGSIFANCSKVTRLILALNNLEFLNNSAFFGLVNLQELSLIGNDIKNLGNVFLNLPNLSVVYLDANKLTTISYHVFGKNVRIRKIYMSDNYNIILHDHVFENLNTVEEINLSNCSLVEVVKGLFRGCSYLKTLDLSYNKLESFPEDFFASLSGLQRVILNNNLLKTFNYKFDILGFLVIELHHNQIAHSKDVQELFQLKYVTEIQLDNNLFTEFEIVNGDARYLRVLDLSYNQIQEINVTSFSPTYDRGHVSAGIFSVYIFHNNITRVNFHGFNPTSPRLVITIDFNPLDCNCHLFDLLKYYKDGDLKIYDVLNETSALQCTAPKNLKGRAIKELDLFELNCPLDECPQECSCYWKPADKSVNIFCINKKLVFYPKIEVSLLEFDNFVVHLEKNHLERGPVQDFGYKYVTELFLSENKIKSVSWVPPNLQRLFLDHNNISYLDNEILDKFSMLKTQVALHNNPWKCDCQHQYFLRFVRQHPAKILNIINITCENGNFLSLLNDQDLCQDLSFIPLIAVPSMTIFLVSTIVLVCFCYKQEIKVFLYSRNCCLWWVREEDLDKDKLFDAFISFTHKDEDFVLDEIVSQLEKDYETCLHFKNFIVGEFIVKNIADSINNSRRTIIILSPNYLESIWAVTEFRTAHLRTITEKRCRLIVILYKEVNFDQLDEEMKVYLRSHTYLKWGDSNFWSRLKYSMPHNSQRNLVI